MVLALLRWNTTRNIVLITVVVGSVALVVDANEAPHVIVRATPESVICIIIISHATGVPVREDVIEVIAWANPVIWNMSPLSVLIAGVAL